MYVGFCNRPVNDWSPVIVLRWRALPLPMRLSSYHPLLACANRMFVEGALCPAVYAGVGRAINRL